MKQKFLSYTKTYIEFNIGKTLLKIYSFSMRKDPILNEEFTLLFTTHLLFETPSHYAVPQKTSCNADKEKQPVNNTHILI